MNEDDKIISFFLLLKHYSPSAPWFPVQSSTISSRRWALHANSLFPLSSNLQFYQFIFALAEGPSGFSRRICRKKLIQSDFLSFVIWSIFHAVVLTRAKVYGYFVIGGAFIFSHITWCFGDFFRLLKCQINKAIVLATHKWRAL